MKMNPKSQARTELPIRPPTAPSIVFLGLRFGAILCFPRKYPVKYAKMSEPNAAITTIQMNRLYSVISISTMWYVKKGIYTIAATVAIAS
jgi:hypothetical protein